MSNDTGLVDFLGFFEKLGEVEQFAVLFGMRGLHELGEGEAMAASRVMTWADGTVVVVFPEALEAHEKAHHPDERCGHGSRYGTLVVVGTRHGDKMLLQQAKICPEGTSDEDLAWLVEDCRASYPDGLSRKGTVLFDIRELT